MATSAPAVPAAASDGASGALYGANDSTFDALSKITADEPVGAPASTEPPAAPAAAPTPEPGAGAPTTAAPAAEPWLETAPAELKTLMGLGNLSQANKDFLKTMYGELNDFREFGKREDVKAFRELFPNGMDEARQVAEEVTKAALANQRFDSADPTQQAELFGELMAERPDACLSGAQVMLSLLARDMPSEYGQIRAHLAAEHLESIDKNFLPFMDYIADLSGKGQMEQLAKAGLELGAWWNQGKAKLLPQAKTAVPQNDSLRGEQQRFYQEKAQDFQADMAAKHSDTVRPIFKTELAKEAKARGLNLSESRLAKLAEQLDNEISTQLQADRAFQMFLDRAVFKGNRNAPQSWNTSRDAKEQIVRHLAQRAQKSAPSLAQKAIGDWIEQLKEAGLGNAPAPDPTPAGSAIRGGARSSTSGGIAEEDLKNSKLSTADLLDKLTR
jgi:hypothetical protein